MIEVNVNEKVRGFISRFVKMDDCNDDPNIFERYGKFTLFHAAYHVP